MIRHYPLFLLSPWFLLLALAVDGHGRNTGLARDASLAAIGWILQAAGGLLHIASRPFFYHSLMGLPMPRRSLALYLAADALAAAAANVAAPLTALFGILLNCLRFAMIDLGLVLIGFSLGRTVDPVLRRALLGGGPAYVVMDGSLCLGLGGWYLEGDADDGLPIGYAGPSAGWLYFPDAVVDVGAWLTAGMGGYARTDPDTGDRSEGGFLVVEPEVCAFVALTPASRIGIGASYRLGIPLEGTGATGRDLSGPAVLLALRYGAIRPVRRRIYPRGHRPPVGDRRDGLPGGGGSRRRRRPVRRHGIRGLGGADLRHLRAVRCLARVHCGICDDRVRGSRDRGDRRRTGSAVSPEVKASLVLTDFCRLNLGLGLRGTFPVREVPGLAWLDVSDPTLSVDLCFGSH